MSLSELFQNRCFLPSFFVFLLVVCIFSHTQADVPDMMINTDGTPNIHNEEQIWVSPIDSTVVMIVWRDFRLGYRRVGLGVSYDEGHTWVDSLLSGGIYYRYSDPCISGDRLGNFYPLTMNYEDYGLSDFSLWKTTDNGASWSGPFYLVNDPNSTYLEDKEFLAIDRTGGTYDGNMYVAWARFPNPTRIMLVRSTTGGVTWEDTVIVGSPDDVGGWDAGQFAFPFVDADGTVYVVWASTCEIGGNYYRCQRMVKSTDGGQIFTDPEVIFVNNYVYEAPGGIDIYNSVCMDVDITNGPYRGNIYFTVPDGVEDGPYYHSDILFMKSNDGGDSWTTPIRVNDDPLGQEVFQFHQWITVNQKGAVIILFYDQRNDPPQYRKFDTYIAFSFDGGETFTTNYRVSDVSSDPFFALAGEKVPDRPPAINKPFMSTLKLETSKAGLLAEYIGVSAFKDQVHCTWTDTRDGNQNVYYSNFRIPLLPPRLFLPEDGEYQLTLYPTFWWAACGYFDEVTYDLEISTDNTFATIDFEYTDIDTNIFTVSMPLEEMEYFWRVKAYRIPDDTTSDYSNVWSFNVDASAPDVPTLLTPVDSSNVSAFTPEFSWSKESKASPVFYTLQVSNDSLFPPGPEFYEYTDIYDTNFTILDTLSDCTVYYWRVKASDEVGHESGWQEYPFQFTALHSIVWGDDFERYALGGPAQDWGIGGDGNWTIVHDQSNTYDQSDNSFDTWTIADNSPVLSNYRLRTKVKITNVSDTTVVEILGRCADGDFHFGYGCLPSFCGFYIYDDVQGELLDSVSYTMELDTWYYFEAYMCEDSLKFKAWEATEPQPAEYLLEANATSWFPGRIGLRTEGAAARFDDVLVLGFIRGDVNGDAIIDIGDVMSLINYLFIGASAPDPLEAGDANCDGVVDIGDVVYLINYLFIDGPPPGCA